MFLIDAPNNTDNLVQEIASESAVHVSQLPPVWQEIARGRANIGLADPQSFVEMAQLFQYKLEHGDVDLFKERKELALLKPAFSQLFGHLAKETLEFYGLCSLSVDHLRRNLKKKIPALAAPYQALPRLGFFFLESALTCSIIRTLSDRRYSYCAYP